MAANLHDTHVHSSLTLLSLQENGKWHKRKSPICQTNGMTTRTHQTEPHL